MKLESAKSRVYVLTRLAWLRAFAFACLTYVFAMMRPWHAQHWHTAFFV